MHNYELKAFLFFIFAYYFDKQRRIMNLFKSFLTLLILLVYFPGHAQQIRVEDQSSKKSIEGVALFTPSLNKSVITDAHGYARLDAFTYNDSIIFQHPSYEKKVLTKHQILDMGNIVQLEHRIVMLSESVISINRWEQNKREVPNRIETISHASIRFYNPQTAADLLHVSDQIFIQKSQLGGGSPMIRGFAANAVLLVIDGIRMNNAIYRSGNLQNIISLDPNITESSEVIFGPGTVIYGSDALGGVIDFHTLVPLLSTTDKPMVKSHTLLRYASANSENTLHTDISVGGTKWSGLTGFTFSSFSDLRMGSHHHPEYRRMEYVSHVQEKDSVIENPDPDLQTPSGYHQINLLEKLRFRPGNDADFIFSLHYSRVGNVPRYDRLTQYSHGKLKYADWHYGPQKWLMPHLSIDLKKPTAFYNNAKINLAYQYYEESRHDRKLNSNNLRHRTEKVYIADINADFEKLLPEENNRIYYGFEFDYNNVHSTAYTRDIITSASVPAPTRYPDGGNRYKAFAGYLTYKKNVSDLYTFNTGLRINYITLHSVIRDTFFYHFPYSNIDLANGAINGSAGFTYHSGNQWQFKLNLSSGFRAPNLDDIGKIFDSEPGRVIVPNPHLKPEYLYSIDFNLIKKNGSVFNFDFSAFSSYLHHAMVRRPFHLNGRDSILYDGEMSEVQALTNTSSAVIYGASATVSFNLPLSLTLQSSLTFNKGKDHDGYALRHVPPLFGATHLRYDKSGFEADLYIHYNGAVPYKELALSERSKTYMYATDKNGNPYAPAWGTLNFLIACHFHGGIIAQFGIENIPDVRYRSYSSGITGPGRNFIMAFRYRI